MKKYLSYKNQIKGFKEVYETLKAIEKIAASQIHFLKKKTKALILYSTEIKLLFPLVFSSDHFLFKKKKGKKALLLISGNKALVGDLYHKLVKVFLENRSFYDFYFVIGKKGKELLEEEGIKLNKTFLISSEIPSKEETDLIIKEILKDFKSNLFTQLDLIYPKFISFTYQEPVLEKFLPLEIEIKKQNELGFPIFEPSRQKFFSWLLERYLDLSFYRFILETKLSEFSARTIVGGNGAKKSEDLIKKLSLKYFKERQREITQKQLESFAVHNLISK